MEAILQLFRDATADEKARSGQAKAGVMPSPMQFSSAELHTLSLAISAWAQQNPGMPTARTVAFKIDAIRGAWSRYVRENS